MAQIEMTPETLGHALAQTQQQDERDDDWWLPVINESGWILYLGDEHGIGRQLPYALIVIDVQHAAGEHSFLGPVNDTGRALGYPVIVFADELKSAIGPTPTNRQSDGNTYIYQLYGVERHVPDDVQDFAALLTGRYKLEIMVPLFKTEPVVSMWRYDHGYRVSAGRYVYDSVELEEGIGFMGIVRRSNVIVAPRGFVWKLCNGPVNIKEFENEMHARAWVYFDGNVKGHMQPEEDEVAVRASPEPVEHLKKEVEDDAAGLKVEDSAENLPTGDEPALTSDSEDGVAIKSEPDSEPESKPLIVMPDSKKRKRSRHDLDELWVCRGGKRMKF